MPSSTNLQVDIYSLGGKLNKSPSIARVSYSSPFSVSKLLELITLFRRGSPTDKLLRCFAPYHFLELNYIWLLVYMIVVKGGWISMSRWDPTENELGLTTRLRRVTAGAQVFHARLMDCPRKAFACNGNQLLSLTSSLYLAGDCLHNMKVSWVRERLRSIYDL